MQDIHIKMLKKVEEELSCAAHSIDHVMRVYHLALDIAGYEEDVDMHILIPSVLLHDIARVREDTDPSKSIDHALLGAEMAGAVLKELDYVASDIEKIQHCIRSHRFRNEHQPESIEAKILSDADKLDVVGAVGVARMFMLAGQFGEKLYEDVDDLSEADKDKNSPNQEYERKLKKIPDRLFTRRAKEVAEERMQYMDGFFQQLHDEILMKK